MSEKKASKELEGMKSKVSINLRMPYALREKLKNEAWRKRKSLNTYVLEILAGRKNGIRLDSH